MSFRYVTNNNFNFNSPLESILKNRGVVDVREFLNPTISCIEDELYYDNMDVAANILIQHIKSNDSISIVVDCDGDGYTSAAVIFQYTERLIDHYKSNSKLSYVIHDDKRHGLDTVTVDKLINQKPKLIIIPDAGSNDHEQHEMFFNDGIEILILDHHECDKYSEHAIVVNNQLSCRVNNKAMTGVGVVYKYCKYIDKQLNLSWAEDFLDLLSVGMIADSCDLRNTESRFLTLSGLKQINKQSNKNKFITSLVNKKSYDMKNMVTILGIAFYISPLINSIIRNGTYSDKELMFKAFINSDEKYIDKIRGKGEVELSIQDYVVRIAEKCKRKQAKLIEQGLEQLSEQVGKYKLNQNAIIVVNGTGIIEPNYTGLIANKLASVFQKPCLLLRDESEELTGSGRGYDKNEIKDFKEWCNNTNLFDFAQGHGNAFGVKINSTNVNKLYEMISQMENKDELTYHVDGIFSEKSISKYIIESIARHSEVWGTTITEPLFALEELNIDTNQIELIGAKKTTLKFKYKDIQFIKFKSSENEFNDLKKHKDISITAIGRFGINSYNGSKTPQVTIENFKFKEGKVKFRF